MHDASDQPEFMKTVKEIRTAEEEHDRIINSANEKADVLVRKAKERALEERARIEGETVAFKNAKLKAGAKDIEAAVQEVTDKAKDDAAKISKKTLDAAAASKIAKDFLGSL